MEILQRPSSRKLRQSCFQQVDHILPCQAILIHILKSYKTMMLILVLTNQTIFSIAINVPTILNHLHHPNYVVNPN